MFNLHSKKSCGDLSGEHSQSITCVAATDKHVLSGAEDGVIVIWRSVDMAVIHKLIVKNVSAVKSLSMHQSQRMCLALYNNGMLRLWNMLDARCIFKKKVGLPDDDDISDGGEIESEYESEGDKFKMSIAAKYTNAPEIVKWEPLHGEMYAVLFMRMLEIYSVTSDAPIHKIQFDCTQTGFDFIEPTTIVVTDEKARLTLLTHIEEPETISMKIVETSFVKFRSVTAAYTHDKDDFFSTVSKEGVEFWNTQQLLKETQKDDDMIFKLKPAREMKLN